jgi:hypothetical protein
VFFDQVITYDDSLRTALDSARASMAGSIATLDPVFVFASLERRLG